MSMNTYTAIVSPGDHYLLVHVPEIDQWTQARTEAEIVPMATDLVATWLDLPASEVAVVRR